MSKLSDVEQLKSFCEIINARFAKTLLEEMSVKKEDVVKNIRTLEKAVSQQKRMVELIGNKEYEFTIVVGSNIPIALNILNWMLEK